MPIYEYRCDEGHTFEVMQRISDDPVASCATCSAPVQRVFHPIAVHFKGSGFYNTDYGTRKRAKEKENGGESGTGESSSSSETKSGSDSGGSDTTKKSEAKKSEPKPSPSASS